MTSTGRILNNNNKIKKQQRYVHSFHFIECFPKTGMRMHRQSHTYSSNMTWEKRGPENQPHIQMKTLLVAIRTTAYYYTHWKRHDATWRRAHQHKRADTHQHAPAHIHTHLKVTQCKRLIANWAIFRLWFPLRLTQLQLDRTGRLVIPSHRKHKQPNIAFTYKGSPKSRSSPTVASWNWHWSLSNIIINNVVWTIAIFTCIFN